MDCPQIPQTSFDQIGKRIFNRASAERIPTSGLFELTWRCNMHCVHCYCNLPLNDRNAIKNELNTKEIFNIFDQIAEAGCLWLLITGGEPLVRKDFLEIYTYAKKKGFLISLFTNGTLITPEIADYLEEWPPYEIEITLYGATRDTHEQVTGIPGSFKRCVRGIDLLLDRKIPLGLKTMAMTLNSHELQRMRKFAEKLGLNFRFDPEINPRLDGSKTPCNLRLSPQEVIKLDLADKKRVKEWREFYERALSPIKSDCLFNCGAGITVFNIDPFGKMSVCGMVNFKNYDLRQGSFKEGWEQALPEILALKAKGNYRCGECELLSLCGQCPGWAWLENGNPEEPVEYLCQVAHLRAETFYYKENP